MFENGIQNQSSVMLHNLCFTEFSTSSPRQILFRLLFFIFFRWFHANNYLLYACCDLIAELLEYGFEPLAFSGFPTLVVGIPI